MEPKFWRSPDAEDIALLRLTGDVPAGCAALPLAIEVDSHRAYRSWGFPLAKATEGLAAHVMNLAPARRHRRFIESIGLRSGRASALAAGAGELAGGLLLMLGLVTLAAAALLRAVMFCAIWMVHGAHGLWATDAALSTTSLSWRQCSP